MQLSIDMDGGECDDEVEVGSWRCKRVAVIRPSLSAAPLSPPLREESSQQFQRNASRHARPHPALALIPPPCSYVESLLARHDVPSLRYRILRFTRCRWPGMPYEKNFRRYRRPTPVAESAVGLSLFDAVTQYPTLHGRAHSQPQTNATARGLLPSTIPT
ncbi:hypothetical protein EV356DRAFT_512023 [Viridothelium virens]|uniref:Uncharacterized protein n=1 Tax=Viridothelium virens TaxID=1048519 RepID=A0A6A6GTV4_VIRVR|nr:hypothetical protein EV356DRAFT_512023 [Viridothelium virens]